MVHNSNTQTNLKTYKDFTYDHAGRLLETYQQIGNDPADKVLIAQNEYNELGELVKKNLHKQSDNTYAQSVDYRYNIRGWLNRINNSDLSAEEGDQTADFFGMELFYNYGFDKPQFNGNISGARWKNIVDVQERAYGYTYDAMNRLTGADYIAGETGNWTLEADRFEVGNLTYDMNGNILSLHRNGLFRHTPGETAEYGITDQLGYKYKGNQLMAVNDAIDTPEETKNDFKDKGSKGTLENPEYDYDHNGNMTRDGNKGINIGYNYLNLPKRVDFGDGKYMEYTYDAAGTKLYQIVVDGENPKKRTDYIAGMVYENDKLQFMQHEEGRVIPPGLVPGTQPTTEYEYQYHLKDHLGNVRLTFTTSPEIDTDGASVEPAHIEDEKAAFLNYDEVTKINYSLFDHTRETESQYFLRLSGGEREKIGLAKSMAVMTGDTIRAEVFGKYLDPDQTNWSQLLQEFITAVAENTVAPGTVIEASIAREGETFPFGGLLNKTTVDQQGPQAYLNYLVFDKDFVLVEDQSGYVPLTQAAKEDGSNIAHELLNTEIIVGQPGYVYIYLSNDNPEPMEVYFDDFHITHAHSAIVQADDYYPFGLTFDSYRREYSIENSFKFQGQKHIEYLEWDSFKWRNHQPDIGRFFNIDPMGEAFYYNSPYAFSENKVTTHIELEGLEAFFIHGTKNSRNMWTEDLTEFIRRELTTNKSTDVKFSWNYRVGFRTRNWLYNDEEDRMKAAGGLAMYVMRNRKDGENITLIAHSHGGNVAILAAEILFRNHGVSVDIVNFNTPAYNDFRDKENPEDNFGIRSLIHFYTKQDGVAGGLAGSDKYRAPQAKVKNIMLSNPLQTGWISSHFMSSVNLGEVKLKKPKIKERKPYKFKQDW